MVGGPLFWTSRSAPLAAVEEELLNVSGSSVLLPTVAVLLTTTSGETVESLRTTSWKVAEAPSGRVVIWHETVPEPPTGGVVQVDAGPLCCVRDTKVVWFGMASSRSTLWASLGPKFVTVTV